MLCEGGEPVNIEPIAYMETPYPTKFGVPRQPELADKVPCTVVVHDERAIAQIEGSVDAGARLWLTWVFDRNAAAASARFSPTVRPPRLGGERRVGVFATRSSFRPNSLALSTLEVSAAPFRHGEVLHIPVCGADMVDGTPVLGIYPYRQSDVVPDAGEGWLSRNSWRELDVDDPEKHLSCIPDNLIPGLLQVLSQDPRPAYTRGAQDGRRYWVPYGGSVVVFTVENETLTVADAFSMSVQQQAELAETGTLHGLIDDE